MKLNAIGLSKRRLYEQVRACADGTESHLASIKSLHTSAWEAFAARKCDPPDMRTEYQYSTRQGDGRTVVRSSKRAATSIDPRTVKAIRALERDCLFCWHELHRAIDSCVDGSRAKIRAIDALGKWRRDYDKRWDSWQARGNKKLPTKLSSLQDFAVTHGQIHFVAHEEKYFASAKEAQRFIKTVEARLQHADAEQFYHSETFQQIMAWFDDATSGNGDYDDAWKKLDAALKHVAVEDEGESDGQAD